MSLRAFTPSRRAPWRVLLRLRSVREGALRRARNPVQNPVRNPVYLLRLSRVLRSRALRFVRLLRVRLPPRFLLRQFLLCARLLACLPPLT